MTVLGALHLAVVAHIAWGHVRPLCVLVARLVRIHPKLHVTFFTVKANRSKIVAEIARNFEDGEGDLERQIRVVGLDGNEFNPMDTAELENNFEQQLQNLVAGKAITCAAQQTQIPALQQAPNALIVDIFHYSIMQIARRVSPQTKIWGSGSGSLASSFTLFGPFAQDSHGQQHELVHQHVAETGMEFIDAAFKLIASPSDKVIQGPGLLPMFKYENFPQDRPIKAPFVGLFYLSASSVIHECDAYITQTAPIYEPPEGIKAFADFFAHRNTKMHMLGPLIPDTQRSAKIELEQAAKAPELVTFMQDALQKHGKNSLVYIAFGTLFWCMQPDRIWTVLDVLIERKTPFILSHASPFAKVPDEVAEKVEASGMGFLTSWAPQQTVLEHPATGWFLSHGGFNSITESIDAGVPLICWPFTADQPLNALHLTENLGIAYELLEVRTGSEATKPVYRTGKAPTCTLESVRAEAIFVFEKAFGEDGVKKRAAVQKLKESSLGLWKEGGSSRNAAQELLESL